MSSHSEVRQKIAEYLKANPELTYKAVAEKLHCAPTTISSIAREFGVTRQRKALSEADLIALGLHTDAEVK
jgi:hypothetical protein